MPVEFSVTERITARPEHVFRTMTDLDGASEWMPNLLELERLDDGPLVVGSEWRESRRMFGREATEHFEVTGLDAPRTLALRVDGAKGSSKKGEYLFHYELTPDGDETVVRLDGEIRGLDGVAGLLSKLFVGPFRKACAKDLAAMKAHLEEA